MQQTEELPACRACMATNCELHELEENGLAEKFQQVTSLRLCTINDMPKHICSFCRALLIKAYRFRLKCLETDKTMSQNAVDQNIRLEKEAYWWHELSISERLVVTCGVVNECVKNEDDVAVKEEPAEIEHLQHVDGYIINEPVKAVDIKYNDQVISNDDSNKPNASNHARGGVNGFTTAVAPTGLIQLECHIKCEVLSNDELNGNFMQSKDSHEASNEDTIHNMESHPLERVEEDVNAINIQNKEEIIHYTEVEYLDEVQEDVNAIEIHDINECFYEETVHNTEVDLLTNVEEDVNATVIKKSKRKVSSIFEGNTMKRLKSVAAMNESDIVKRNVCKKVSVDIGKSPFNCDICGKMFKTQTTIQTHIRKVHSKVPPYACAQCGKTFKLQYLLKRHNVMHTGEHSFECDICGKMFKSRNGVQIHIRHQHSEAQAYPCTQCGEVFKWLSKLMVHQKRVHTVEGSFGCDICSEVFQSSDEVQIHITQVHSEAWPYPCAECGKVFKSLGMLKSHQKRMHMRGRNFGCGICGKMFRTNSKVQLHARQVHSEERPYPCAQCGKAYKLREVLKDHQKRVHIGDRSFCCDVCGKMFKTKGDVKVHIRHKHNETRPYSCK